MYGPNFTGTGAWIKAYVVRPSLVTKPGIPGAREVDDPQLQVRHGCNRCGEHICHRLPVRGDSLALRHGDDRDVGVEGADAVRVDQLLLGLVTRLTRQREVERPPVTERPGGETCRRGTAPARPR